jgi:hypothetical protein
MKISIPNASSLAGLARAWRDLAVWTALSGIQVELGDRGLGSAKTRTFRGSDGDEYLTRATIPGPLGCRLVVHRIHRGDEDPHPHSHPWRWARFLIASGGYDDERWTFDEDRDPPWRETRTRMRPGDVNVVGAGDYHRVVDVLPRTTTLGLLGPDVQGWGFMIPDGMGEFVPWQEYLLRKKSGEGRLTW